MDEGKTNDVTQKKKTKREREETDRQRARDVGGGRDIYGERGARGRMIRGRR